MILQRNIAGDRGALARVQSWADLLDRPEVLCRARRRDYETRFDDLWFMQQLDTIAPDLGEFMGVGRVRSVLDLATGDAQWIRRLQATRPAWLHPDHQVMGVELESPVEYDAYGYRSPKRWWGGLTIIRPEEAEAQVGSGSMDLIHESYFAKERIWDDFSGRFERYDSWLRPGGFLLFAHHDSYGVSPEQYLSYMDAHNYGAVVFRSYIPRHYPLSYWFELNTACRGWFLILAKKPALG